MSTERESLFYPLRCRLGAWLLREHIAASCQHYSGVASDAMRVHDWDRYHRVTGIAIGLKHAMGIGTEWRRLS